MILNSEHSDSYSYKNSHMLKIFILLRHTYKATQQYTQPTVSKHLTRQLLWESPQPKVSWSPLLCPRPVRSPGGCSPCSPPHAAAWSGRSRSPAARSSAQSHSSYLPGTPNWEREKQGVSLQHRVLLRALTFLTCCLKQSEAHSGDSRWRGHRMSLH